MVAIYANKILDEVGQEGAFTIDRVPERWKQGTIDELAKRGYDQDGQPLPKA